MSLQYIYNSDSKHHTRHTFLNFHATMAKVRDL